MRPDTETVASLSSDLASGRVTSRELVERALARSTDAAGEGARAFIKLDATGARAAADAMDALRKAGASVGPIAGIPFAIKDLADIQGQVTAAGSTALADTPPARSDAPVVARLRAAGLVITGRLNMTEFAYSGLGINPHYGTPLSPWDRPSKRVPGGSSAGSGVAVADGMVTGALGTDTGGSCRIPAAFNGVVGYKPTARRVPTTGVVPLSTSLDSIGPLAPTVACCAAFDAVMAGEPLAVLEPRPLAGLRLFVPETTVLDGLDQNVSADFDRTLGLLAQAGAQIKRGRFAPFERIPDLLRKGGLSGAESHAWHRNLIATKRNQYDPRVLARIMMGERQSSAEYIDLLTGRQAAIQAFTAEMENWDAILSPTVPIVAPRIADVETDENFNRINMLVLRNTLMLNVVDGCSIALPMSRPDAPPTSLMVSGVAMADNRIFAISAAIEAALGKAH
jgi:aspartyl-tRNA(Asn)/glutamyl-tRNA(Gln) amidotransferase subunit A